MTNQRIGIVVLAVLVLLGVLAGAWWWNDRQAERELEELRTTMESRVAAVQREAREQSAALHRSEARAAFRSFAAGIAPSVLAKRGEGLDQAVGGLLEVPGVVFVHVIQADGAVLATSDRKLATLDNATEYAQWALGSTKLTVRESEREGVLELAAPVVGPTGPAGYLWMGYDTGRTTEATRPEASTEG